MATQPIDWRLCFTRASESFVGVVASISKEQYQVPGLGVWTIRDLVGHTTRALLTIETYLAAPVASYALDSPIQYFRAGSSTPNAAAAIAQRGREAGAALGPDPSTPVRAAALRVAELVAVTSDETALSTPSGSISFRAYLPTRVFELTVHSLDLLAALGQDQPATLAAPIAACLELAAGIAGQAHNSGAVLLALTGRHELPARYSIV